MNDLALVGEGDRWAGDVGVFGAEAGSGVFPQSCSGAARLELVPDLMRGLIVNMKTESPLRLAPIRTDSDMDG